MAPKKKTLKSLPRKAVSTKKASAVKGAGIRRDRLAANHNQALRSF